MWSLFVLMPPLHAVHVIEMLFGHDYESVQAFELQRLGKPSHMCPQIRSQWCVAFHNGCTGFQHFILLSRVFRVIVPHHIFGCESHVILARFRPGSMPFSSRITFPACRATFLIPHPLPAFGVRRESWCSPSSFHAAVSAPALGFHQAFWATGFP